MLAVTLNSMVSMRKPGRPAEAMQSGVSTCGALMFFGSRETLHIALPPWEHPAVPVPHAMNFDSYDSGGFFELSETDERTNPEAPSMGSSGLRTSLRTVNLRTEKL